MIRIISKKEGFRRAGIPHSVEPQEYADDHFAAKQLAALKAEPMLKVTQSQAKKGDAKKIDDEMTVAQLKKALDKKKVKYSSGAVKNDLISLYMQAGGKPPKAEPPKAKAETKAK